MTMRARTFAWLITVVMTLLVWARPALAAPQLSEAASRGRVTVYAESGLESQAAKLAEGAEAALTRISADLVDLPRPRRIEVRLVRDSSDLAAVAPAGRGAPPWAIGVAYPDLGIISIAVRRNANLVDPMSTLKHELGHIALGVALGARAPHWLHEGFAYQHSGEWSWDRTETLAGMAWFGGVVSLDELDRTFPREELPAHRAYAQSYDFVGFLSRRGRWEDKNDDGDRWPFRRFLTEVGRTGDLDSAAKIAFGRPLRELFEEWRSDLTNRYMLMPVGLLGLALWIFCAFLLTLAYWRRRRQNRKRMAQWDLEEQQRLEAERAETAARAAALAPSAVFAPSYVPWPGEDPLAEPDETDGPTSDGDPNKPARPPWIN
ncbi:MAG: hypothetical protein JWP01_290 [Myxococcales bacterium]|nr:hypothetical protein [Myxococcales bacterium]